MHPQLGASVEAVERALRARRCERPAAALLLRSGRVLARPAFLTVYALAVAGWILLNLGLTAGGAAALDPPPFFWLQGAVALTALAVSILVLVSQEHQRVFDEQRAHLDLEVNLLAEQKIAKLIGLVEELRRDMPNVRDREDPEAVSMARAANPHAVLHEVQQVLGNRPSR